MTVTHWHRLQGLGLYAYASLVWRTARYRVEGEEHIDQVHRAGRPLIIAAWHGMTMMLVGAKTLVRSEDPGQYVTVVVGDHRRTILSRWARRIGAIPYVISMEADSMVAARRLLALIRHMEQGKKLFLMPDGPDGPSHEPKEGIVFIARKVQAMIVPAGAFTATAYRIPRWDRYVLPFPFSRIAVVFGVPLEVPLALDLEQAREALRERLNQVEQAAERLYHQTS